ncbi:MAG: phosphoenolpyruvate carboxylase [Planctomycetota bacterium]
MSTSRGLSPRLKHLVGVVEAALGRAVAEAEGEPLFQAVEDVRQSMVRFRGATQARARTAALEAAEGKLAKLTPAERLLLARAYTLYLELVNACENAYRTHRLRSRPPHDCGDARARVVYVMTAHPTESRSPENIRLLRRISDLLARSLDQGQDPHPGRLDHLMHLLWRVGTHPPHKPTVEDEADHLVSLLSDEILGELLELRARGHQVLFRTWVGGDKDGHPGVGPEQTAASLQRSRARLLTFVRRVLLGRVHEDLRLLKRPALDKRFHALDDAAQALAELGPEDGKRVRAFGQKLDALARDMQRVLGRAHPDLARLRDLLGSFPALVLPLELREERGRFGFDQPLADMLRYLRQVAQGGAITDYVRGCVVSMTGCAQDLWEAFDLVKGVVGRSAVPVVPLFELPEVLPQGAAILTEAWTRKDWREAVLAHGHQEVMLGYSDTSKRMGVLASRLAIHDALRDIGEWGEATGVEVVFFHGSGGSVGRGGGTIEEQAAIWPRSAVSLIKQTLQGEMVERTLATPEILSNQISRVASVQADPPGFTRPSVLTEELAAASAAAYQRLVADPELHELLRKATPYTRLDRLTIGSRPSSRGGGGSGGLEKLRAIPWILCWTQTRFLLPAWLGVGSAWRELEQQNGERRLRRALEDDPLLRSYLRQLGFTLAKTAPRMWEEYVRALAPDTPKRVLELLRKEWTAARDLALAASPAGRLLPDRPWLLESIYFRAPMIHPLNLLQIQVLQTKRLKNHEALLFRETVTGIAAGMLTTG